MSVESPAFANQNSTYGAEQTRRAIASLLQRGFSIGSVMGGVAGPGDCLVTPPGSGMSVNVAAGELWVPGSTSATQSGYYGRVASTSNLAIATSDPTNPRIDRVSALVTDSAYSGATNTFAVAVETGTATTGATLVNLTGVASAPASSYTLGYVLVPAAATNIIGADIANVSSIFTVNGDMAVAGLNSSGPVVNGFWYDCGAGVTATLPTPYAGSTIGLFAGVTVSGASPVTVTASLGGIYGRGLGSTSFKLGTPGAAVILEGDGSNWAIIAGVQDTGWVTALSQPASWSGNTFAARVVGDKIEFDGAGTVGTNWTAAVAFLTLPAGMRPTTARNPSTAAINGATVSLEYLTVTTGGVMSSASAISTGTTLSLEGITIPLTP